MTPRGGTTRSRGGRARSGGDLEPMLARSAERPFSREGWFFEMKYDGVRALLSVGAAGVRVTGRSGADETARYPEAQELAGMLPPGSVADAEIVAMDALGRPSFARLQSRIAPQRARDIERAVHQVPVSIVMFDLLRDGTQDITARPLHERKARLATLLRGAPEHIIYADHVEAAGTEFYAAIAERGLEGVIAKRAASPYRPGVRSDDWVKIKAWRSQTCCIVGFTPGRGSRAALGALCLAVRVGRGWRYAGNVGGGMSDAVLAHLVENLRERARPTPPILFPPRDPSITWVRPDLLCEVRHAGFTAAGVLRHPVFLGLRPDAGIDDCAPVAAPDGSVVEYPVPGGPGAGDPDGDGDDDGEVNIAAADGGALDPSSAAAGAPHPLSHADASDAAEAVLAIRGQTGDVEIDGLRVHLTNLDKEMWPGVPKRRLIAHYVAMAPVLLPHLHDRGLGSQVFPDGIDGKSFWRKQLPDHAPEWMRRWTFTGERRAVTYAVADSAAALAWLANSGAIDLHPWHSRIDAPEQPDWAVFDLDPAEGATFADVVVIAKLIHVALDHLQLRSCIKTTGQTGLQIYVPLRRGPSFAAVRDWVEEIGHAVGQVVPDLVSWEWTVSKRTGRIRIDYTQNVLNKTLAAPYSLRPAPGAPVSIPITWDELEDPGLRPNLWTIDTAPQRIAAVGDLFAPVLQGSQELPRPGRVEPA